MVFSYAASSWIDTVRARTHTHFSHKILKSSANEMVKEILTEEIILHRMNSQVSLHLHYLIHSLICLPSLLLLYKSELDPLFWLFLCVRCYKLIFTLL